MKILAVDCRMAQLSGIGVYLRNLLPLCMERMPDVRFRLLAYDKSFPIPSGCRWEAVPFGTPIYSLAEQYKILPLLKGCDVFWNPHYPVPVFTGLPIVVTVHDVAHLALRDLYSGMKWLYATLMLQATRRKASELLFVSEFSRQEFLRHVGTPRGNTTVVHNGADPSWGQSPLRERAEPPYFLAVGNIKPHKNIRLLCRAFARIADTCDARLLLVGEHTGFRVGEQSLENITDICPGRIQFTGFVPQEKLNAIMGKATALVFPSRYEGFGLPLIEALCAGIPVIASDLPVCREVCGDFAAYFASGSEEGLAERMREVLTISNEERRRAGENGRAWAAQFTWEQAADATVNVLRRACALPPQAF